MHTQARSFALVGREAELQRVDRLIQELLSGHGALLLLSGESGVGKTALATAIAQRAQALGAGVAFGRCYETGGMPPSRRGRTCWPSWTLRRSLLCNCPRHLEPHRPRAVRMSSSRRSRGAYSRPRASARSCCAWKTCTGPTATPRAAVVRLTRAAYRVLLMIADLPCGRGSVVAISSPTIFRASSTIVQQSHSRLRLSVRSETAQLVESRAGAAQPRADHATPRAIGRQSVLHRRIAAGLAGPPPAGDGSRRSTCFRRRREVGIPRMLQQVILQRVARLGQDGETLLTTAAVVGPAVGAGSVETRPGLGRRRDYWMHWRQRSPRR